MSEPCRILIVEDNEDVADVLEAVCAQQGYTVVQAHDAATGRAQIARDEHDVVIIDVALPGGEDGFALARRAAQTSAGVILITGNHAHAARLEASGHAYLLKPFRLEQLIAAIDAVMRKSGADCVAPKRAGGVR